VIELHNIRKTYYLGDASFPILQGIELHIRRGEFVALTGASGSGKSTLMNILGCLDTPTEGRYRLAGEDVATLGEDQLARVRNRRIGFIFQSFHLLPRQTALANVAQPLVYRGIPLAAREAEARACLERVGLGHRLNHRPNELSGGQRQRVAIARALVGRPQLLLADEPTGNLDSRTTAEIMELLADLHAGGLTVVIVTHEPDIAAQCLRVVKLRDGRIDQDEVQVPVHPPSGPVSASVSAELPLP